MKHEDIYKAIGEALTNAEIADTIFECGKNIFGIQQGDNMVLNHIIAEKRVVNEDKLVNTWIPIYKGGMADNLAILTVLIRAFIATNFGKEDYEQYSKILQHRVEEFYAKGKSKKKEE